MTTLNTSTHPPQYYHQFKVIHGALIKFTFPYIFFIAIVGLITNTSTVILLSKNAITKKLKNKWTLIALALSDLLFNTALLIRGILEIFKGGTTHICLAISFLSHLAEFLSACYTVLFTIQRFTAVRYPLEAAVHRHSSPIISLLFIFIFCSIFCFVLAKNNAYIGCREELKLGWFIADAVVSFFSPFSLILIYNILIVNYIRKHSRSPISVQSTLRRKKKNFKNNCKTYHHDDTCETDNNTTTNVIATYTHNGGIENIDLEVINEERISSIETEQRPSVSFSLDRVHSETSSNQNQSPIGFHSVALSKKSSNPKQCHASDSLLYHLAEQSLNVSNDGEVPGDISTRTSQSIRVTRMLILVSICFLILNAPAHLCLIVLKVYIHVDTSKLIGYTEYDHSQHLNNLTNNRSNSSIFIDGVLNQTTSSSLEHGRMIDDNILIHILYIAVALTQLIAYASYSINFFLYSFSGISFRTSLKQLINRFPRHSHT